MYRTRIFMIYLGFTACFFCLGLDAVIALMGAVSLTLLRMRIRTYNPGNIDKEWRKFNVKMGLRD